VGSNDSSTDASASPYRFELAGNIWHVSYEGQSGDFKDQTGMHYIQRLLSAPHRPVPALELRGHRPDRSSPEQDPELLDWGGDEDKVPPVSVGVGEQKVVDDRAIWDYKRRMEELIDEINEAVSFNDSGREKVRRAEFEALAQELKQVEGLHGRIRKMRQGDPAEKARVAAKKAITRAIEMLAEGDPPQTALTKHLRETIKTEGTAYAYRPQPDAPPWRL
jgi:hypothetical protein